MNVEQAVAKAIEAGEEAVLVAKPPLTWGAEAMYVELTNDYRVPQAVLDGGYEYLLGREDLLNLLAMLKRKAASGRTAAEFVIHFAVHDAYPAWFDDLPNA